MFLCYGVSTADTAVAQLPYPWKPRNVYASDAALVGHITFEGSS